MKRSCLRVPRPVRGRCLYLLVSLFVVALVAAPAVAGLSDDVLNSPPPPGITPVGPPPGEEAEEAREPVPILSRAELEATARELSRRKGEREARRQSDEGKAERKASKRAHKRAGKSESVALLRREFPGLRELRGKPLALPPGGRVREYVSDNAARIEDANGETTQLAVSAVPLRVPTGDGDGRRPLDLTLAERGGGFEPVSPAVPLRFDATLDEGLALGRDWIRVFFEAGSAAVEGATGSVVDQKAYYHEAATDTDFVVTPTLRGFESFTQLRSIDSPEVHSLRFELPAGAVLRTMPDGGAQIVDGERELVRIARPTAVDAQEQEVPVVYEVEGAELRVVVRHRDLDAAYPILVDPVVEISPGYRAVTEDWITAPGGAWVHNPSLDRKGWDFQSYLPGGTPDWFYVWNGWFYFCTPVLCNGSPNGLSIVSRDNAPYPGWSFGQWLFKTKGDVYIPRVDYAYVQKTWANNNHPNDYYSYVATGIHSNSLGRQTASYAHYGPNVPNHSTIANSSDWTHGSTAHFSLVYQEPHPAGYTVAYLGGAIVYLMDRSNPQVTAVSDLPTQWLPGGVTGEITAIANDAGLGINGFGLKVPGHQDQARIDLFCGDRNKPCPNQRSNIDVGGAPLTYDTSRMPEGVNTVEIAAMDALWKLSPAVTRTIKVDKSAPAIALSGPLYEQRDQSPVETSVGPRRLHVAASDGRSGVKSIAVRVDGTFVGGTGDFACPAGGCSAAFDYDLNAAAFPDGPHDVEVAVRDQVDNRSVTTFQVTTLGPTQETTFELSSPASPDEVVQGARNAGAALVEFRDSGPSEGGYFVGSEGLDSAVQSYRAAYVADEPGGGSPPVIAFTLRGSVPTSALGVPLASRVSVRRETGTEVTFAPALDDPDPSGPDYPPDLMAADAAAEELAEDSRTDEASATSAAARGWAPSYGSSQTMALPAGRVFIHTMTWATQSAIDSFLGYAYEHDVKLYEDPPGGLPSCVFWTGRNFWADRRAFSWRTNFPRAAKPYRDTDASDTCDTEDFTIGLYHPGALQPRKNYRITIRAKAGSEPSSAYSLVAQRLSRVCDDSVWCVGVTPGGGPPQRLVGRTVGVAPECRRWRKGHSSRRC